MFIISFSVELTKKLNGNYYAQWNLGKVKVVKEDNEKDAVLVILNNEFVVIYDDNNYESYFIDNDFEYVLLPFAKPKALLFQGISANNLNQSVRIHIQPRHVIEIERYFRNHGDRFKEIKKQMEKEREKKIRLEEEQRRNEQRNKNRSLFLEKLDGKTKELRNNVRFMTIIGNYISGCQKWELSTLNNLEFMDSSVGEMLYKIDWLKYETDSPTFDDLNFYNTFIVDHQQILNLMLKRSFFSGMVEGYILFWHFFKEIGFKQLVDDFESNYKQYFQESSTSELSLNERLNDFINIQTINITLEKNIITFTRLLMKNGLLRSEKDFSEQVKEIAKKIKILLDERKLDLFEAKLLSQNEMTGTNNITINDIDLMTGHEFELFVASLFEKWGFIAMVTKGSGDQGIDVIVEKNGEKLGIQTKCYSSDINNKAVQEVVAGIRYYDLDKGMVLTNQHFTKSSIELAKANNIVLWDREMLKEKISTFFR